MQLDTILRRVGPRIDEEIVTVLYAPHILNNIGGDLMLDRRRLGHLFEKTLLCFLFNIDTMLVRRLNCRLSLLNEGTITISYRTTIKGKRYESEQIAGE